MQILMNQVGLTTDGSKKAVLQCTQGERALAASIYRVHAAGTAADGTNVTGTDPAAAEQAVLHAAPVHAGTVARWNTGDYYTVDFSALREDGFYVLQAEYEKDGSRSVVRSLPFEVSSHFTTMRLINAAGYYFKAQRSSGEWLDEDRHIPFQGQREGFRDAHGGWFDATGDYGIHMSHLGHSGFYSPQQASFSALVFFLIVELMDQSGNEQYSMLRRRMLDEGFWGCDWLMRMHAPSGTFIRSVNRKGALTPVKDSRFMGLEYHGSSAQFSDVAATADLEQITDANYEVSLRNGGGAAIAALAAAGRFFYPGTDYSQSEYVETARTSWRYLRDHNDLYTNDGENNLVDEVCAVLALTELWKTTKEYGFLQEAREWAERIYTHMEDTPDGGARLYVKDGVPYVQATEEGLPIVTLLLYAEAEQNTEAAARAEAQALKLMRHAIAITDSINNPFGYPALEWKPLEEMDQRGGNLRVQFFFPHDTTAAPWWQGDNARIASIAAAARLSAMHIKDEVFAARCRKLAEDVIDWILGCNPFDSCMMEGYGQNNIQYFFENRYDFLNCPGGIVNGITSGIEDEEGIAFVTEPTPDIRDNWRWAEQWIPHVTWFMYAVALRKA